MLEALERHPAVRLALHYSGPLLGLAAARATGVHRAAARARRARPGRDHGRRLLRAGARRRCPSATGSASSAGWATSSRRCSVAGRTGAWLAERVWEPDLPTSLVAGGYAWTILDDAHFRAAAIPEEALWGPYTTEDQGRLLTRLRHRAGPALPDPVPRGRGGHRLPPRPRDRRRRTGRHDGRRRREVRGLADDLEALLGRGSLGRPVLRGARGERRTGSPPSTPSAWLGDHQPIGRVYVPTGSYAEMGEWALPADESRVFASVLAGAKAARPPRGALAARRVLAQLPGQVPRDQRPAQADAAGVGQGRRDGGRPRRATARSTTSTRASRTTATGTASSGGSTSATCAWRRTSTSSPPRTSRTPSRAALDAAERLDLDMDGIDEVRLADRRAGRDGRPRRRRRASAAGTSGRPAMRVTAVLRRRPEAYHERPAGRRCAARPGASASGPTPSATRPLPRSTTTVLMKERGSRPGSSTTRTSVGAAWSGSSRPTRADRAWAMRRRPSSATRSTAPSRS